MKIDVLNSKEISSEIWDYITDGFNKSFDKSKSADHFKKYYQNTVLGYSFHALAYNEENRLIGSTTVIPQYYVINGDRYLIGLSGGSYVLKEFRNDIFIFHDMVSHLRDYCNYQGIKFIVGVSNKNSFKYSVKILGVKHLMDLDYYLLPIKAGDLINIKRLLFLNLFSSLFFKATAYFNYGFSFFFDNKSNPKVELDFNESFIQQRFKEGYKIIKKDNYFISYKCINEDGLNTIYLMEYRKNGVRSYRALSYAIKEIIFSEKFDILLFIGTIRHFQINLIKVPKRKHPKQLPLTYDPLKNCEEEIEYIISQPINWDFSLVNFDVR